MEIKKIDGRFHIEIPRNAYDVRENFKKTFSTSKWHSSTKTWSVGPRSGKKLEEWVKLQQSAIEKKIQEAEVKAKMIAQMVRLEGHTYDFKEELQEKFNAVFHSTVTGNIVDKAWYVAPDIAKEAQAFLIAKNAVRNMKMISNESVQNCSNISDTLDLIKQAINNIQHCSKSGSVEYKYHDDDFFQSCIDFGSVVKVKQKLEYLLDVISKYVVFADENDNQGIDFDPEFKSILSFFKIPQNMVVDFARHQFMDFAELEKKVIIEKLGRKHYRTRDIHEISKELDDAKHSPVFKIVSKKTGVEFDVTHLVEIERKQSSRRVHYYNAKNIPVLNDERFFTRYYYWRNSNRSATLKPEE